MKVTVNQIKEMIREVIKEEDSGYKAFFNSALKKFGASSIADLGDKKAEFFKYVDDNYTAKTETLEPVSSAAGEPEYNPTQRLKAKKRDQILKTEKVENYVRKLVREELKFVMFNDVPGGLSMKRAKKRILQKGSAKTDSTV